MTPSVQQPLILVVKWSCIMHMSNVFSKENGKISGIPYYNVHHNNSPLEKLIDGWSTKSNVSDRQNP